METQGSVENVWLLDRGDADFALMQSDVAALAAAGEGPFARGGPIATLRALASLFPEPIHVVVAARSAIGASRSFAASGSVSVRRTRAPARTRSPCSGRMGSSAPTSARRASRGPTRPLRRLPGGSLDAFFLTIAAPTGELQDLATRGGMRLVSLDDERSSAWSPSGRASCD